MPPRWQERAIRVAYFIRIPNVGDRINSSIVTAIAGPVKHTSYPNEPHLFAIGSLMAKTSAFSRVWGTGVVHPDYGIGAVPAFQVHALRGRLSHSAMRRGGIMVGDIPLGDPAYLAPRLLGFKRAAAPKFRAGLVPHYVDRSNPLILHMQKEPGVADLNVHDSPEVFLARMAECETVISSSLHGLVFAEALGIPNVWIRASENLVGGEFKFQDWFSTTKRPRTSFHLLTGHDNIEGLSKRAEIHESVIDSDALIGAFPLDHVEEMTLPEGRRIVPVSECRTRPTPVFLISLNQGELLKRAIAAIRGLARPTEIIIHDEGSTCPETLAVLGTLEASGVPVFRYPAIPSAEKSNRVDVSVRNYFADWGEPCRYAIADGGVDISMADPQALDVCDELLNTHPKAECAGPMLRIQRATGIAPTSFGDVAIAQATVDTELALHRAGEPFRWGKSGLLALTLASGPIVSFASAPDTDKTARVAYVEALRAAGASETVRWKQDIHHHPSWGERGEALARMVKPGEKVFEFGAGRSRVPEALPAGCGYTASDLAPLAEGVLPYDLNASVLMPIPGHDLALLSGVLEYVHDLSRTADFLANNFEGMVCSYAALRGGSGEEIERRRYSGWFTDLTEDGFIALFVAAGFTATTRGAWGAQTLFRFDKPTRP